MIQNNRKTKRGVILLIVLGMLTFFSLLTAAYLVFSNQARQTSFAIASRNVKQSNPNEMLDLAAMILIRGTDDQFHPFFGEDLLSDYYGRSDFIGLVVDPRTTPTLGNDFIRISIAENPAVTGGQALSNREINDLYAGRVITFTNGPLRNNSFRVLRSISTGIGEHDLIFQTTASLGSSVPAVGNSIWMNGVPLSSPGIGFDGTGVNGTVGGGTAMTKGGLAYTQRNPALNQSGMTTMTAPTPAGINSLPVALQPNHLGNVSKDVLVQGGSDFDESYDAADFNNWFLSHRDSTTNTIIPSFHRPSVINYLLNEDPDWSMGDDNQRYLDLVVSMARATMRPIPIARNQFTPAETEPPADPDDLTTYSLPINGRFTGGNQGFALRAPLLLRQGAQARLNQLAQTLINGPWDVDNDLDGLNDSNWMDIGLPVFVSPEGKLLKPLIAPMIRDLSGRLNLNAHSNFALINQGAGLNETVDDWADATGGGGDRFAFRGLGYGPGDINIPVSLTGVAASESLFGILRSRYAPSATSTDLVPGRPGADSLGVLTNGWRPSSLSASGVYHRSIDPYGRSGYALSQSGDLVAANDGTVTVLSPLDAGEALGDDPATTTVAEPTSNEVTDTPYESDPTGRLSGDRRFTEDEVEGIARANEFDSRLLPNRLFNLLQPLFDADPSLRNAITTTSKSDNSPAVLSPGTASAYHALLTQLETIGGTTLTNDQLNDLIAPELRLARRFDINRRIGNGIDDNSNGVVDEPREIDTTGYDDDGNGMVDDLSESNNVETEAFASYAGNTVASGFSGVTPDYLRDSLSELPPRQQLARHLYVLMMLISNDLNNAYPSYGDTLATAVPVSNREAYRARRIAQWAINVVDYRDPDAVMSRFPYDPNPFDGWAVADDIDGDGTIDSGTEVFGTSTTPPTIQSPVVWGCEQPELLFSESYAAHDVRVRDTDFDTDNMKGSTAPDTDQDTDQVRVPQGSLLLELYCPRRLVIAPDSDPNTAGIPEELYDVDTTGTNVTYSLDMERTISTFFDGAAWGIDTSTSYDVPVWRIAISEPHFDTGVPARNPPGQGNSPIELRSTLPDTLSFQPELGAANSLDELNAAAHNLTLERFVFFGDYADAAGLQDAIAAIPDMTQSASVFFNATGTAASLFPEQYLALAPRVRTSFGSKAYATTPTGPSDHGFEIQTAVGEVGLMEFDPTGTRLTPRTDTEIQPALALSISTFAPTDWTNSGTTAPNGIGLNISEPLPLVGSYYTEPTNRYINIPTYPDVDAYVELDSAGLVTAGLPRSRPEDMRVNGPIRQLTEAFVPATLPSRVRDPMLGTVNNYCTAFLQRLADPTRGFHPTLNPYRTVDQIPIDLTVFSGEDAASSVIASGNTPSVPTIQRPYARESRQRDGVGIDGIGANVLHSYSTSVPTRGALTPGGVDFFFWGAALDTTYSYLNSGFGAPQTIPVSSRGRPTEPFAIHPWLNRPYASPYELMLVPACSAGRLLEEFSVVDPANPNPAIFPDASTSSTDRAYAETFISPFRHVLNFFNSENIRISGAAPAAEFSALFDLICTPPPFRGESQAIVPSRLAGGPLAVTHAAPYNFLTTNQVVGRINLNTIEEFATWRGLMQGHMNAGEFSTPAGTANQDQLSFDAFNATRRGYTPAGTTPTPTVLVSNDTTPVNYAPNRLDPRFPTQFAGVFRKSLDAQSAPRLRDLVTTTMSDDSDELRRRNAHAGLVRGRGTIVNQEDTGGAPTVVSMFVRESTQNPQQGSSNYYQDRNKNAFLRYQSLMRMPNLVTDSSQTFEVRLTLGFFEVNSTNVNDLGIEYKEDQGENQRYHAMFIIDRSVPVGFIPGQDVNARDTVIFERYFQ